MTDIHLVMTDSPDWESVIEIVPHHEAQKHLNQWRHKYKMIILNCYPIVEQMPSGPRCSNTYLSLLRKPYHQHDVSEPHSSETHNHDTYLNRDDLPF